MTTLSDFIETTVWTFHLNVPLARWAATFDNTEINA